MHIRPATDHDIDALIALENASFSSDRLSRRSMRRHLGTPRAVFLVAEDRGLLGYVLVFLRRGTSLARTYSIAVAEQARGGGVAVKLLEAAEQAAVDRGRVYMRLEVNPANRPALALYEKLGYRRIELLRDYYEDHADAVRMEKRILYSGAGFHDVPFVAQSTLFTCGPASLLMAMHAVDADMPWRRHDEIRIWREATTVFMTRGHGGCGPHGLALAAWRRGFDAHLLVTPEGPLFLDGVRSEAKKQLMREVHQAFLDDLSQTGVRYDSRAWELADIEQAMNQGGFAIVLISSYALTGDKAPHWVCVTGIDEDFVYIHDPDVDEGASKLENQNLPVDREAFSRMAWFGKSKMRAAVVVGRKSLTPRRGDAKVGV